MSWCTQSRELGFFIGVDEIKQKKGRGGLNEICIFRYNIGGFRYGLGNVRINIWRKGSCNYFSVCYLLSGRFNLRWDVDIPKLNLVYIMFLIGLKYVSICHGN